MTSLNNPVNLPLDTNGYVKSSIWAQNINPNVNTAASVTGNVGGNVVGSVASVTGNVGGNVVGSVASVTNPVTSWTTISHQTGLSAAVSTALAPVNIGTAIAITKDGKIQIASSGHVSADVGGIRIARTRSSVIDYINQNIANDTSTSMNSSLFSDGSTGMINTGIGFVSTSPLRFLKVFSRTNVDTVPTSPDVIEIEVLNGDSLQFQVTNSTSSTTVYIDDLVVQQQ